MTPTEVKNVLNGLRQASDPGKVEDGTRVHIRYSKIPGSLTTARAASDAARADELELPLDAYTGRVSRVWQAKDGSTVLTAFIELERDHTYRSFNIDKGNVRNIVVLGD